MAAGAAAAVAAAALLLAALVGPVTGQSRPATADGAACGARSSDGPLPWYGAVLSRRDGLLRYSCSATVIAPRVLISAAHCQWDDRQGKLLDPGNFTVVVGKYEHGPKETPSKIQQLLEVEKIFVPEKFRGAAGRYAFDISVIVLKSDIRFSALIHPICIDLADEYSQYFTPGKIGILGSWGVPVEETYKQRVVSMPIVDFAKCNSNIPSEFTTYLTFDKFCAGTLGTQELCTGDSGAGLANQFRDGRWYLTGVASVGVPPADGGACDTKYYKGFTRVSQHRNFIQQAMSRTAPPAAASPEIPEGIPTRPPDVARPSGPPAVGGTTISPPSPGIPPSRPGSSHGKPGGVDGFVFPDDSNNSDGCAAGSFQCHSGECIDARLLCNGAKDCRDGSDEAANCGGVEVRNNSCSYAPRGCALPKQPINGRYTFVGCSANFKPGEVVPVGVLLNYTCSAGFELIGPSLLACHNGWSSQLPVCSSAHCKPLRNPSRYVDCVYNGRDVDCQNTPVIPGTRASVSCKEFYESIPGLQSYDMICDNNGKWNRELHSCIPKCGVPNPLGVPLVGFGQRSLPAQLPWHVGFYVSLPNGTVVPSCGGSLVSTRAIVSAAHCFWKNGELYFEEYKLVAGKYHYSWETKSKYVQHLEIQRVILPRTYRGHGVSQSDDIAVIILKSEIHVNQAVRPICVDYEQNYLRYLSPLSTVGNVTGWGKTENQTYDSVLKVANLPYIDITECERNTPAHFHGYLTADKFCAGNANKTSVCAGDSGGGFAVTFRDGRSYLVGVVSIGASDTCALFPYAAFTNVFSHLNFIREHVSKYV